MITDEQLLSSPTIRAAIARMDRTKVTKVAATLEFGKSEPSLEEMLTIAFTKAAEAHLRQQRIDAGLSSFDVLTGTTKEANVFGRLFGRAAAAPAAARAAGAATHGALPAAEQLTHLVGTQAGVGRVNRAMGDALGPGFAREIPAYARDAAHGGTFTPMELPLKHAPAATPAPAGALRTKARPTMSMDRAELPAMFSRTEAGGISPAVAASHGGTGILPGGAAAPGGPMTFQGVPGAAAPGERPAMFNLADLMKGEKTAQTSGITPSSAAELAALAGVLGTGTMALRQRALPEDVRDEGTRRALRANLLGAVPGGMAGAALGAKLGPVGSVVSGLAGMGIGGELEQRYLEDPMSPELVEAYQANPQIRGPRPLHRRQDLA